MVNLEVGIIMPEGTKKNNYQKRQKYDWRDKIR